MMAIGELADIKEASRIHRNSILAAEVERLAGAPTYTTEEVRTMLSEKFCHAESQEL